MIQILSLPTATISASLNTGTEPPRSHAPVTSSVRNVTSAGEREPTERPIPPEVFGNFYGTIRDAKFDGLHWLRDLDPKLRNETEKVCKDVLEFLDYPLVYPQEKRVEKTTQMSVNLQKV